MSRLQFSNVWRIEVRVTDGLETALARLYHVSEHRNFQNEAPTLVLFGVGDCRTEMLLKRGKESSLQNLTGKLGEEK